MKVDRRHTLRPSFAVAPAPGIAPSFPIAHAFAVALLLAVTTLALPGPASAQDGEAGRPVIRGILLDADERTPVQQGLVRLFDTEGAVVGSALSDADGAFTIVAPGPGTFRVEAERIGYVPQAEDVILEPGDEVEVDLLLRSAAVLVDPLLVVGDPGARPAHCVPQLVLGRVVDEATQRGIAGATMRLLRRDGEQLSSTRADGEGRFAVVTPSPGAYLLQGEANEYVAATSEELMVLTGDTISLDFQLATDRSLGSPMVITASARPWEDRAILGRGGAILERMEGCQQDRPVGSRFGEFVDRSTIAEWEGGGLGIGYMLEQEARQVWDYAPNGTLTLLRGCVPVIFWDGRAADPFAPTGVIPAGGPEAEMRPDHLAHFTPETLEAVEVHTYPHVPREYWGAGAMSQPCGAVALWTRTPEGTPEMPSTWKRAVGAVAALVAVIILAR